MKKAVDINEIVWTTFYTIDRIREEWGNMAGDALILYFEYIKKWRMDWTNQPRASDRYMMTWLWRWKSKFASAKKILKELWLIESIQWRNNDKVDKRYTKINFIISKEKIEWAMSYNPESGVLDNEHITNNPENRVVELWTGETIQENAHIWENVSYDHYNPEKLQPWIQGQNALSTSYKCLKKKYTTYISKNSDNLQDTHKTKLDITADDLRNAYWWRPNRKWTKKEFDKLVNTMTQQDMQEAILELHLLRFEYRLHLEDINMCNSCVNAINNRATDEDMIRTRIEKIVDAFQNHKNKNEKTRQQWELEIKEWFWDYIEWSSIWKPDRPTTKEWWISLFEEMDLKWQLHKLYERFPEVNLSIVEADWAARHLNKKKLPK